MKKSRLIATLAAVSMLASSFAPMVQAGETEAASDPSEWPVVSVDVLSFTDGLDRKDEVQQALNDYLASINAGVQAEFVVNTWGDRNNNLTMLLSDKDNPIDLFSWRFYSSVDALVKNDQIISLEPYKETYPDLFTMYPEKVYKTCQIDGQQYSLPSADSFCNFSAYMLRKSVAEDIGVADMDGKKVSLDELNDILTKAEEAYPDQGWWSDMKATNVIGFDTLGDDYWLGVLQNRGIGAKEVVNAYKTEEFRKVFEEKNGDSWINTRESFVFFEDDVVATLQEVLGMSEEAARNWFNGTETVETSIAQLVSEIKDYVDKKPDNFRLLFMIDEVGQYVGENTDHLLNLQSLIEEIGSKCEGKVWVMCTGQEALDEIIKTRQDEFSRIQARFKTRLSLSSTSADEVIQKRLLSKTDEAEEELEKVYNANDSVLRNLLKFNKDDALLDVRGFETPQEFARDFPFVPYQFLLLQKVYTAIRKHGNAGKHQSSGERSMLSGFQEAAKSVQEQDEFALVPFYKFYDTVKTSLDGAINRVIDRCQNAADEDRGIKQQDVDVLKLLYLIRYVDTDVKSTLDSIVILMADNINMDKIQMRAQVQESLDRLLSQNYIGRNGNTYNFLTDEEQDIARDIKETPVDTAQIIERIGHLVFGDIYDKKKYRYKIYDFPYDQYVDGTAIGSVTGGMKLQIYSIATDDYEKQDLRLQTNSKGQAIVVLGDGKYYECIESALKIRKYVKTRNISQLPKSVQDIIRAQQDEATKYEGDALDYIKRAIEEAEYYVDGEHIDIKGGDAKSKLDQALEYLVTHVYYDLDLIGKNYNDDSDIIGILTGQNPTLPGANENSGAAQKIEGYLEMQDMKHITTKMSDIQTRYQGIPSGWREIDIAAVVALLIYEQKVTIKYGGMTIQPTDPKLPDMLRKKTEIGKTEITKRHVVSPTKMKEARDFLRDFLDVMDVPADEDGLVGFIIDEMTKLYNEEKTDYDPLTDDEKASLSDNQIEKWEEKAKSGLLRRDQTIGSLLSNMRTILNKAVTVTNDDGSTTQYTLASLGIVTSNDWTENGKLHILGDEDDETYSMETNKLKAALDSKPEIFSTVFAGSDGFGKQMNDYMMKAMKKTETSHSLTFYNDITMDEEIDDYDDKIDELNKKLSDMEDKYYDQFAKMESAMAKLQQQQSYLASLMGTA